MTATEAVASTRPASGEDARRSAACSQACIVEGAAATLVTGGGARLARAHAGDARTAVP